ncbi:hypothetical protein BOX15_Mlig026206g2 [Macrostomum lignano]|uniref:Uncharacterized protein n=1 Tax=Macrostomum lignano TaxID=282301 RepID=A0A267FQI4_9PLAT|nr:hypothetical protein BOX15_Mlig026206g2 [Macrostomum lignano]
MADRNSDSATPSPVPRGHREIVRKLVEARGTQLEHIMYSLKHYLRRISMMRLDRRLPQRTQVIAAKRALKQGYNRVEAMAVVRTIAEDLRRDWAGNGGPVYRQLLVDEVKWLLDDFYN